SLSALREMVRVKGKFARWPDPRKVPRLLRVGRMPIPPTRSSRAFCLGLFCLGLLCLGLLCLGLLCLGLLCLVLLCLGLSLGRPAFFFFFPTSSWPPRTAVRLPPS